MKSIVYYYLFVLIMSYLEFLNSHISLISKKSETALPYSKYQNYKLSDTINIDLNTDKFKDKIILKPNCIEIFDGKSNNVLKLNKKNNFYNNYKWVESWGVVYDKITFRNVVKNSELLYTEEIKLKNPSVFLWNEELGGGIITFKNKKYYWIHQAQ